MRVIVDEGLIRVNLDSGETIGEFIPVGDPAIHRAYIGRMIHLCVEEEKVKDADKFVADLMAEIEAKRAAVEEGDPGDGDGA
jgi:hypothetical protein